MDPLTLIVVIVIALLLLGWGGGTYYARRPGYAYGGPPLNLAWVLIVLLIIYVLYTRGAFA